MANVNEWRFRPSTPASDQSASSDGSDPVSLQQGILPDALLPVFLDEREKAGFRADQADAEKGRARADIAPTHVAATTASPAAGDPAPIIHVSATASTTLSTAVPSLLAPSTAAAPAFAPAAAPPVSPSLADEVAFISGVSSTGAIAPVSFRTWNNDNPATYDPD